VYLFGSLAMAATFAPSKLDMFIAAYERALQQVKDADKMDRYGPSLAVRLDTRPGNVRLA